jgi:DNA mismatch repair ATPase MutS
MRAWALSPTQHRATVAARLSGIRSLHSCVGILDACAAALRRVRHVPSLLSHIEGGRPSAGELTGLAETCAAIEQLTLVLRSEPGMLASCAVAREFLTEVDLVAVQTVAKAIRDTIEPPLLSAGQQAAAAAAQRATEGATSSNRTPEDRYRRAPVVRSGIHGPLDDFRKTYGGMDRFLTIVAEKEMSAAVEAAVAAIEAASAQNNTNDDPTVAAAAGAAIQARAAESLPGPVAVRFVPQVGYLLAVPRVALQRRGVVIPAQWATALTTEDAVYYKTDLLRQVDEHVGDVHAAMCREEALVLRGLYASIQAATEPLLRAAAVVADLDCLCAYAAAALREGWCCPTLVDEPTVRVRRARHPLLSRVLAAPPVPFDLDLGCIPTIIQQVTPRPPAEDHQQHTQPSQQNRRPCGTNASTNHLELGERIVTITGPNGSGKSILMRTVALCVYMCAIGCYVPCDAAHIGVFDAILSNDSLTEVAEQQGFLSTQRFGGGGGARRSMVGARADSLALPPQLRSSFAQELAQVGAAAASATGRTLLLLDEFGSGTVASDGIALLGGVMRFFALRPRVTEIPLVLACTHFTELAEAAAAATGSDMRANMPPLMPPRSVRWISMQVLAVPCAAANRAIVGGADVNDAAVGEDRRRLDFGVHEEVATFRPVPGTPHAAASSVFRCAHACGFPDECLNRLAQLLVAGLADASP